MVTVNEWAREKVTDKLIRKREGIRCAFEVCVNSLTRDAPRKRGKQEFGGQLKNAWRVLRINHFSFSSIVLDKSKPTRR